MPRSRTRFIGLFVLLAWTLLAPGLTAGPQQDQLPDPSQMNRKQLEGEAKELAAQAKALEKQGRLEEAHDKYVDAEGYVSTKEALSGIDHIRDQQRKQVEAQLNDARRDCDAGKFSDCASKLEKGLETEPSNLALHYDLVLCYQKLGDRDKALQNVDAVINATRDNKQRADLLELRSALITGVNASASGDAKKKEEDFDRAFIRADRTADESAAPIGGGLCDRTKELQALAPANPAVLYDAAKCAEEDGNPGEAARLLGEYLRLAPQALDAPDVQWQQQSLQSLAALEGDAGAEVRAHFAAAARNLDYRRYDRAITEYRAAEIASPGFPLTQWRLALLFEASGDVAQATGHFQRYQQLAQTGDRLNDAADHLSALQNARAVYDDDVDEAHDLLGDLLLRSMGLSSEGVKHRNRLTKSQAKTKGRYQRALSASQTLSAPYVQRQLDRAQEDLIEATEIFPIAPEAGGMLALIDLEGNDWQSALHGFDAVAGSGLPVSFYAQASSSRDSKIVRATKVEIGKDSVRLVYLSYYNAKKQISEPPQTPAGDDDLGNLFTSATVLPDLQAESRSIAIDDLQEVKTDKSFVTLKLQKEQLLLAPVFMLGAAPVEGRHAREFGNEYTRMFVRYLGYESARLGKEGMTFGEKLKLGYSFVDTGMNIFNAINTGGVESYSALQSTLHLVQQLKVDLTKLRRAASDRERVLEGQEFKAIPTEDIQINYRDHP